MPNNCKNPKVFTFFSVFIHFVDNIADILAQKLCGSFGRVIALWVIALVFKEKKLRLVAILLHCLRFFLKNKQS